MAEKTITLRADLIERLETLAKAKGRSVDEVLDTLLESQMPSGTQANWAVRLAETMAAEEIDWQDEQELSTRSRDAFQDDLYRRWQRSQRADDPND
jgi:hypothetical protein